MVLGAKRKVPPGRAKQEAGPWSGTVTYTAARWFFNMCKFAEKLAPSEDEGEGDDDDVVTMSVNIMGKR